MAVKYTSAWILVKPYNLLKLLIIWSYTSNKHGKKKIQKLGKDKAAFMNKHF